MRRHGTGPFSRQRGNKTNNLNNNNNNSNSKNNNDYQLTHQSIAHHHHQHHQDLPAHMESLNDGLNNITKSILQARGVVGSIGGIGVTMNDDNLYQQQRDDIPLRPLLINTKIRRAVANQPSNTSQTQLMSSLSSSSVTSQQNRNNSYE